MPHVSSSGGGDDLGSEDEVKVFKDEGEEEKRSSENLTEDKSDLIDLTESEEKGALAGGTYATTGKTSARSDLSPVFGKVDPTPHTSSFNMGYLVSPYPYPNGAGGPIPVSMNSLEFDDDDGDDGDNGFVSGMPFVCSLRRKNYGIVLIVKILASERLAKEVEKKKERDKRGL
ncbi:PREDICTED: protein pangolin, isoforms A/H/I/S-like [Cyphomyrmex costatus]|uniref:protein pangolin, isoforms A/H/I/S-like n=1 Tax=Cyphomyrmex costatus TaxID=456900 RepID=UPI0008522711|nr:PREDICTED: protein pangolin, isoforms A/H/I/S-like [Cyphomyrmex costatus]